MEVIQDKKIWNTSMFMNPTPFLTLKNLPKTFRLQRINHQQTSVKELNNIELNEHIVLFDIVSKKYFLVHLNNLKNTNIYLIKITKNVDRNAIISTIFYNIVPQLHTIVSNTNYNHE